MQAGSLVVDRVETGGLAREPPARIHRCLHDLKRAEGSLAETLRFVAGACAFGHAIEVGLGLFDLAQGLDFVRRVERAFNQIAAHGDQFAQQREIVDLFGQLSGGKQTLPIGGQLVARTGIAKLPFLVASCLAAVQLVTVYSNMPECIILFPFLTALLCVSGWRRHSQNLIITLG